MFNILYICTNKSYISERSIYLYYFIKNKRLINRPNGIITSKAKLDHWKNFKQCQQIVVVGRIPTIDKYSKAIISQESSYRKLRS